MLFRKSSVDTVIKKIYNNVVIKYYAISVKITHMRFLLTVTEWSLI